MNGGLVQRNGGGNCDFLEGEIVIFWREKLNTYVNVFSIFVSDCLEPVCV